MTSSARKYNLVGVIFVAVVLVMAAAALYIRLTNAGGDERYTAENYEDGATNTIMDESGETVVDTRTDADLEAMYQASETAYEGD